jgi:hypothetical protein
MLCDVVDALPLIHAGGAMRGRLMNCESLRQQSTAMHCKAPQLERMFAILEWRMGGGRRGDHKDALLFVICCLFYPHRRRVQPERSGDGPY